MTSDRELLEAAAKAAGYELRWYAHKRCNGVDMEPQRAHLGNEIWNPLADDGDALRIAVKLRMDLVHFEHLVRADVTGYDDCHESNGNDPYAATRRAIVRAAAASLSKDHSGGGGR